MKKITEKAIQAFKEGKNFKLSNTEVVASYEVTKLYLFDNLIAEENRNGFYITSAGWKTNTTRERLNGFSNVYIQQKKDTWYLNGEIWENPEILTLIL